MMSMTTDQVENCNTVTGSCRPTWFEYPQYRFSIDETDANTPSKYHSICTVTECDQF